MKKYVKNAVKSALSKPLRGRRYRRLLSIGVSALLSVSTFLTVIPQTATSVYAAGTGKKLQLGASALADNAGASGAATVYYGKNNQTWRVIGYGTTGVASTDGKLAMLAGSAMGSPTKFNEYSSGQDCNNYAGSLLKNAVDAIYSSTYFTEKEMGAIIKRDLNVQEYSATAPYTDGISGTALTGDNAPNLWPLSTKEAYTLYNNRSGITNIGYDWWLRSPGDNVICAAYVNYFDNVLAAGDTVDFDEGVRPAFNINLSSIILTSAASGGKSSGTTGAGALTAPDNYTGNEWKLTVNDTSRSGFAVNRLGSGKIAAGGNMRFNYRGAKKADNEYVSAILLDGSGSLLAYGRIVNTSSSTSGTSYITLPSTLVTDGNTYTLQFISEQYHTNKSTDYSSLPSSNSITFTAGKGTPTAVDFNVELPTDTTYDGSQKSATVTAETGVSGMGNITVKYKDADNNVSTSAPTDPGTYQILLDVAAGTYYDAADNITDDDWTFTISTAGTVATPTFSPAAGTYSTAQNVAISCTTDGATIHYTTDGSTPTASSQTYSNPISVSETTTIKAFAAKSGMADSDVASAEYTINHTDKTITGLCTGAIGNPTSGAGGWSYVYYGQFDTDNDETYEPTLYRVLDKASTDFNSADDNTVNRKTMLLDCDSTIKKNRFDDGSNVWANSAIRTWLKEMISTET